MLHGKALNTILTFLASFKAANHCFCHPLSTGNLWKPTPTPSSSGTAISGTIIYHGPQKSYKVHLTELHTTLHCTTDWSRGPTFGCGAFWRSADNKMASPMGCSTQLQYTKFLFMDSPRQEIQVGLAYECTFFQITGLSKPGMAVAKFYLPVAELTTGHRFS